MHPQSISFEVTNTALALRGLDPAHDGLRIAQISDVHIGDRTPVSHIAEAVRMVNAARPDVVFLTGDYVTSSREPIQRLPLLADLKASMTMSPVTPTFRALSTARSPRRSTTARGWFWLTRPPPPTGCPLART